MTFRARTVLRKSSDGHVNGRRTRPGFSLIEVIIATAILMGSAIVLAKLAGMGRDQSQKASLYSEAQQLCEQTLNELLLGVRPIEFTESQPLLAQPEPIADQLEEPRDTDSFAPLPRSGETGIDELDPKWLHSIRMDILPDLPGMWSLTVVVTQNAESINHPVRFSLTRWIAGPIPVGAFEELSHEQGLPASLNSGGLL
jgi:type II secretory pathway pseudopilin PulG